MLEHLFGSSSVSKILLFLLLNETCYASQLKRFFGAPLTPLQKALARLEKGGVIVSSYEGKTRLFRFNPHYPLLRELEMLLRRAWASLPPRERRKFYYIAPLQGKEGKESADLVVQVWQALRTVGQMAFTATPRGKGEAGWRGTGRGVVRVREDRDATLLFEEEGTWVNQEGKEFRFTNVFRWTLNRLEGLIGLEHLRFGQAHPVFLFHLVPAGPQLLESLGSHLCEEDAYFGQLKLAGSTLELLWRIVGPKKNEEVEYQYLPAKSTLFP